MSHSAPRKWKKIGGQIELNSLLHVSWIESTNKMSALLLPRKYDHANHYLRSNIFM